jgi:hypothetical protein
MMERTPNYGDYLRNSWAQQELYRNMAVPTPGYTPMAAPIPGEAFIGGPGGYMEQLAAQTPGMGAYKDKQAELAARDSIELKQTEKLTTATSDTYESNKELSDKMTNVDTKLAQIADSTAKAAEKEAPSFPDRISVDNFPESFKVANASDFDFGSGAADVREVLKEELDQQFTKQAADVIAQLNELKEMPLNKLDEQARRAAEVKLEQMDKDLERVKENAYNQRISHVRDKNRDPEFDDTSFS